MAGCLLAQPEVKGYVIIDRYADRLELMQHLLNFTSSDSQELLHRAKLAQSQLRVMPTPYLLYYTVAPNANTAGANASQWAYPIFKHCAMTHTSKMIVHIHLMTTLEHLLLKAVEETTKEICRVTTKMWATDVMSGLDTLFEVEPDREPGIIRVFDGWRDDIQELISTDALVDIDIYYVARPPNPWVQAFSSLVLTKPRGVSKWCGSVATGGGAESVRWSTSGLFKFGFVLLELGVPHAPALNETLLPTLIVFHGLSDLPNSDLIKLGPEHAQDLG
ncbi:hypothetical protein K503DRAFT_860042 [Rhizopogon vinicolor AM-OR11-026]|uniref:Uncharacterized protein n=1 Tax=Rhizopogon vinicolor AM-OR11-026 TaxID=1314800 RepID=A0A1B7MK81_9AGAM|nr:hypothetical protein K503DRAFT_860042 [Rhizopogon vinicolor AM-OR11-026]